MLRERRARKLMERLAWEEAQIEQRTAHYLHQLNMSEPAARVLAFLTLYPGVDWDVAQIASSATMMPSAVRKGLEELQRRRSVSTRPGPAGRERYQLAV